MEQEARLIVNNHLLHVPCCRLIVYGLTDFHDQVAKPPMSRIVPHARMPKRVELELIHLDGRREQIQHGCKAPEKAAGQRT